MPLVGGRSVASGGTGITLDEANRRWSDALAEWAIPEDLIHAAPESPYFFDPAVFITAADEALARGEDSPSDAVARDALDTWGSILDVGCGAGAASLRLQPTHATGVDPSAVLLGAFASRADQLRIRHSEVEGTWPAVAGEVGIADVVVCHHVAYNVADLAAFASELSVHARRRVVLELTAVHPMAWLSPYWTALHGLAQPDHPTADDALDVLRSLGLTPHTQRWSRTVQMVGEIGDDRTARIARRLCLPPDRVPDLVKLLQDAPPPVKREVITVSW